MKHRATIMVVEDDPAMRELLHDELVEAGYDVLTATDGRDAIEQLKRVPASAVVTDLLMPEMTGAELLDQIRLRLPGTPVVIISAFGTIDLAVRTIKAGAYHFVPKPFKIEELLVTLQEALSESQEFQRLQGFTRDAGGDAGMVAESRAMLRVLSTVRSAATADTPVLLIGETGTGKKLVARSLHEGNPGRQSRFLAIDCASLESSEAQETLFGSRPGQEATGGGLGLYQEASGGTLYLDNVESLPPALQERLLRVLTGTPGVQEGPADVRVIAASHEELQPRVEDGRFRRDLFYRLEVITIRLPPLRDRQGDLPRLVAHFVRKYGAKHGRPDVSVSPEAFQLLKRHTWPGNIQELENAIERAIVLGKDTVIRVQDLPEACLQGNEWPEMSADVKSVAHVEKDHILKTLKSVAGNKAAAARLLGLDRKTLYRKLKTYDISGS